jgi:ribose transport system ATP-binding protein
MAEPEPLLAVTGIVKRFGGTLALDRVDMDVRKGEIHALLGQNGAGKSTLIKVLAGVHQVDEGTVQFRGNELRAGSIDAGIAFVHQDLALVESMTVAENVALVAGYSRWGPLISWSRTRDRASDVLRAVDGDLDPNLPVSRLRQGEKALVAIARALFLESTALLVLDEPTASLSRHDSERLFRSLADLRGQGVGMLYVTHRLDEVFRISDRITVLRDGRRVATLAASSTDSRAVVEMIVGHAQENVTALKPSAPGAEVIALEDLIIPGAGPVSAAVHASECVALVGLQGAGQEACGRALFGAEPVLSGVLALHGKAFRPRNPGAAIERGVGFVSSKRIEEGIALEMAVRENLFLNPRGHGALRIIGRRVERRKADDAIERFDIRPTGPERAIHTLSGGNQQKVVLARWLTESCSLMVLEEPTTGVDVGAKQTIYRILRDFMEAGLAVVLVSSDFDEIVELADRAVVFNRGRVVGELHRSEITVRALTYLASAAEGDQA